MPTQRPTPHQASVLGMIYRQTLRHDWAYSAVVGCRGACEHLRIKGLIEEEPIIGPRGGTTYRYRLTEAGKSKVPAHFLRSA